MSFPSLGLKLDQPAKLSASKSLNGWTRSPGEFISVEASPYSVLCIKHFANLFIPQKDVEKERTGLGEKGGGDDWVRDINSLFAVQCHTQEQTSNYGGVDVESESSLFIFTSTRRCRRAVWLPPLAPRLPK